MIKNINYLLLLSIYFSLQSNAQVMGCTDVLSKNYNPLATNNDGSCVYEHKSMKSKFSVALESLLEETSGLILWKGFLWTHNDDTDTHLYALDTLSGKIVKSYELPKVLNTDWEEIAQDSSYLYVGDFGNNYKGNRKDLHLLRIEKNALLLNKSKIDTIAFSYFNQKDFELQHSNHTNFDCEAMVVTNDSLYLFTKEWKSKRTSIYSLPKTPGNYVAHCITTYNVKGLITGATFLENKKLVVLCGYSRKLRPFVYLLYDYKGYNFFSGNKRKIKLKLPFHQIEGITTSNGLDYYLTSEAFSRKPIIEDPQQLHELDLSAYLKLYLDRLVLKK